MELNNRAEQAALPQISYVSVSHQGQRYRVNLDRYEQKTMHMLLACLLYAQAIIFVLIYILLEKYNDASSQKIKYLPLLIEANAFILLIAVLAIVNRQNIPPFNLLSILAVAGYVLVVTTLIETEVTYQWITAIIFSSLEMTIAIFFTKLKWSIIPLGLLAAQLIFAVLNIQGKLQLDWLIVLSILIGVVFLATAAAVTLIIIGILEYCNEDGYRFFALETIYLGLVQLGYAVDSATIILILAVQFPSTYVVPVCAGYNLLLIVYASYFRKQLILFKSKALLVISQNKKYSFDKIEHKKVIIKCSSNWFNPHCEENKTYIGEQNIIRSSIRKQTNCVICLSDVALLVWLPCGHLTVCEGCGQYLMDHAKLECVICKTMGDQIYHIKVQSQAIAPQFQSDFYYKVTIK